MRFVVVSNKSYGASLKGIKIYFEGKRPKGLSKDGTIRFGKHILEMLKRRYNEKFRWIITERDNSIKLEYGIQRVRTSVPFLKRMDRELWDRTRDIKNDIIKRFFFTTFPIEFAATSTAVYVPGTLTALLTSDIAQKLSAEDKDAVQKFLPSFLATESIKSVNLLKAAAQIKSLKTGCALFTGFPVTENL